MTIQIDTREHARAIKKILATFDNLGVKHFSSKLYVGDYMSLDNPRLIIDRKQNLLEICSNLGQDLERFRAELVRAKEAGIRVVILCEHGRGIKTMTDVLNWVNPRLKESPMAISGERLYRKMAALHRTYGVEWMFCTKAETGRRICEILGVRVDAEAGVD
jgi:hypothetical protein